MRGPVNLGSLGKRLLQRRQVQRKIVFMCPGVIYASTRMGEGASEAGRSRHCYSTCWQQGRFE